MFNRFDARYDQSKNDKFIDVLMATTAAPTFFPPYYIQNKEMFVDGGVHANNPSLFAYNEALRYKIHKENIFFLQNIIYN